MPELASPPAILSTPSGQPVAWLCVHRYTIDGVPLRRVEYVRAQSWHRARGFVAALLGVEPDQLAVTPAESVPDGAFVHDAEPPAKSGPRCPGCGGVLTLEREVEVSTHNAPNWLLCSTNWKCSGGCSVTVMRERPKPDGDNDPPLDDGASVPEPSPTQLLHDDSPF